MMVCELFGDRLCANWESREDALGLAGQQTLALFQERSAKTAILVLRHTLSLSVYSLVYPGNLFLPSLALFLLGYCCSRAMCCC
jgi:hypothetical protein